VSVRKLLDHVLQPNRRHASKAERKSGCDRGNGGIFANVQTRIKVQHDGAMGWLEAILTLSATARGSRLRLTGLATLGKERARSQRLRLTAVARGD
jgi:hypothetical protein